MTKNILTKQVKTLIIENCKIDDESFELILKGIVGQAKKK